VGGRPGRTDLRGDREVQSVELAADQSGPVGDHGPTGLGARGWCSVNRAPGTGQRAEIGRDLSPMPAGLGHPDRGRAESDRDDHEPDAQQPDRGRAPVPTRRTPVPTRRTPVPTRRAPVPTRWGPVSVRW